MLIVMVGAPANFEVSNAFVVVFLLLFAVLAIAMIVRYLRKK